MVQLNYETKTITTNQFLHQYALRSEN